MIILINAEKCFDKIQHSFRVRSLNNVGREGIHLKIKKATYDKHAANIILSGEKLKASSVRSWIGQGFPLSPPFFNMVSEALATAVWQGKETNGIKIENEKVKLTFADGMIMYMCVCECDL